MSPDPTLLADSIRALVLALFFLIVGQSVATIALYGRARRLAGQALGLHKAKTRQMGLLPMHVALISVAFLALSFEAAARTWGRVGTEISPWAIFNLVVFAVANLAMWKVLTFERTRIAETRKMMLYRIDPPKETVVIDEQTHEVEDRFPDNA